MGMRHSIAYISVDGELLATMPGAKLDLGGVERTPVVGGNAVLGYSEKLKPASLECEISLGQGVSLQRLRSIKNATVTYEADTGQTYVMREAFVGDTLNVAADAEGKVALKFHGAPAEEMSK